MRRFSRQSLLFGIFSVVFITASCAKLPPESAAGEDFSEELNPDSNAVVYAKGWEEVKINANRTDTKIDVTGHFETNWNRCVFNKQYGVVDAATWNQLAKAANAIVDTAPVTEADEYCIPAPDTIYNTPSMDGTAKLTFTPARPGVPAKPERTIYELKSGKLCTNIKDRQVADALLQALNKVVIAADSAGCNRGG